MCPAGPLRSTVVTRFIATTSPADFQHRRLPVARGVGFHPRRWISQVPDLTFGVRCPQPPREVRRLPTLVASSSVAGRPDSGGKATSIFVTRPNRVHFRCGPHLRSPGLRRASCLASPPGSLHVERAIYMVNTSQLTSQVRLGLTHRRARRRRREQQPCERQIGGRYGPSIERRIETTNS